METITVQEAIAKGYTHFVEEEGEIAVKLDSLDEHDKEYYKNHKCFIVDMNKVKHFSVSAEEIRDVICDLIAEQDKVVDEEDKLCTIAHEHDYSGLAKELNEKFASFKYYEPTDIELTF